MGGDASQSLSPSNLPFSPGLNPNKRKGWEDPPKAPAPVPTRRAKGWRLIPLKMHSQLILWVSGQLRCNKTQEKTLTPDPTVCTSGERAGPRLIHLNITHSSSSPRATSLQEQNIPSAHLSYPDKGRII